MGYLRRSSGLLEALEVAISQLARFHSVANFGNFGWLVIGLTAYYAFFLHKWLLTFGVFSSDKNRRKDNKSSAFTPPKALKDVKNVKLVSDEGGCGLDWRGAGAGEEAGRRGRQRAEGRKKE